MSFRFITKRGYNNNLKTMRMNVGRPGSRRNPVVLDEVVITPSEQPEKVAEPLDMAEGEQQQPKRKKKNRHSEQETRVVDTMEVPTEVPMEEEHTSAPEADVLENNEQNL